MDQQEFTAQSKGDPGDLAPQKELPKLRRPPKKATAACTRSDQQVLVVGQEGPEGLLDRKIPRATHGDERGSIEPLISKARIRGLKKQAPA